MHLLETDMGKVLLFSDIHIHPHKRRQDRLEDCLSVLDWVFSVAKDKGVKSVLFGGDLFHDRQKIDVYTSRCISSSETMTFGSTNRRR